MKKKRNTNQPLRALSIGIGLLIVLGMAGCKPQIPKGATPEGSTSMNQSAPAPTGKPAGESPAAAGKEEPSQVFAVNTTKAVAGELIDYLELNGDVLTKSTVDIYPDTFGKVSKLLIKVGDRIEKDQVIAEIDPSKPGMIFVPSPVKSPIAGTVSNVPVYVGSTITQGMPIARVTTTDNLEIRTEVAERFIGKMRVGLQALVSFEAFPGEVFRGTVTELSPVVDPTSRTLEIKIRLNRQDPRIRPGMFAALKIITERKRGVVKIPVDCLVRRYGGTYVFVVKDDPTASTGKRVERRKVTPGVQIDEKLEIVKGLRAGEEIVIMGQSLLEDNSVVRIVGEVPPLPVADSIQ
ncbi:MAG: efflux RND transporter periplasmic adaptor subunit [Spirochaetales bacterium]